ncbi:MAG: YDG domain-containing protein, partial [Oscillospiraceae bacterium]|nr:YDG domain-containing protein [Oscillospiraceae bacterium]
MKLKKRLFSIVISGLLLINTFTVYAIDTTDIATNDVPRETAADTIDNINISMQEVIETDNQVTTSAITTGSTSETSEITSSENSVTTSDINSMTSDVSETTSENVDTTSDSSVNFPPETAIPLYLNNENQTVEDYIKSNTSADRVNKTYDGKATVNIEYESYLFNGIQNQDDVYLTAVIEFDTQNVTNDNQNVTLKDFALAGENSGNYSLPVDFPTEIRIDNFAKISPKTLYVAPVTTECYYGQITQKPADINNPEDVHFINSEVIFGDIVNINSVSIGIENGANIKEDYTFHLYNISLDNSNYTAVLPENIKFSVIPYNTEEKALDSIGNETGNYIGAFNTSLKAPVGFLISSNNNVNAGWAESLNVSLNETQNGNIKYYLRNNTPDSDEYFAISTEKTFNYTCVNSKPEVIESEIEYVDTNKVLNFLSFGVFGNDSVKISVTVKGANVEQSETEIYLSGLDGEYISGNVTSKQIDGIYYYTAVFTFEIGENEVYSHRFKAYAVNNCGTGAEKVLSFNGEMGDGNVDKVTIDKTFPKIETNQKNADGHSVTFGFNVEDSGGIAEIYYAWDIKRGDNDDNENTQSGHYIGFKGNNYSDNYILYQNYQNNNFTTTYSGEITLRYDDSVWTKNRMHSLYLKVIDNAGNVITNYENIQVSQPINVKVDIKNAEDNSEDNAVDKVLRFLSFGNYSNDNIILTVTPTDEESANTLQAVELGYNNGYDNQSIK